MLTTVTHCGTRAEGERNIKWVSQCLCILDHSDTQMWGGRLHSITLQLWLPVLAFSVFLLQNRQPQNV